MSVFLDLLLIAVGLIALGIAAFILALLVIHVRDEWRGPR